MENKNKMCGGSCSHKKGFPTLAVLVLILGVIWLLNELGVITFDIPWWPVILIVVALGWIIDRYTKHN